MGGKGTLWSYGDSWERFPIEPGVPWREKSTGSVVQVQDLYEGLPGFLKQADLIYTDPPWNTSNINSFYTKAGLTTRRTFGTFIEMLFDRFHQINPRVCYCEVGKQNLQVVISKMKALYPAVQHWEVTYYRKHLSYLVRGGSEPTSVDFTGMDDDDTPLLAMQTEDFSCVADTCMGRGLIGVTAHKLGKRFVGTELNKRRLAVLIDKIHKLGGQWA